MRRRAGWTAALLLAPALLGLLLFRLVPIGIALSGSLQSESLEGDLTFAGLRNFEGLAVDPSFWHSLRLTLAFNVVINPLQVALAFALALLVFRPGRLVGFFQASFFWPAAIPAGLTAVLWGLLLDPSIGPANGLLVHLGVGSQGFYRDEDQALWTLLAIASWNGCGFWMLFLLTGLHRIDPRLYEAAHLDGAGAWRRFRHITLPQMRAPLAFVLVADTTVNLLFFTPVYVLTSGGPNEATALLGFRSYEAAFTYQNWSRALAITVVLLGISALVAALQLRLLRGETERR